MKKPCLPMNKDQDPTMDYKVLYPDVSCQNQILSPDRWSTKILYVQFKPRLQLTYISGQAIYLPLPWHILEIGCSAGGGYGGKHYAYANTTRILALKGPATEKHQKLYRMPVGHSSLMGSVCNSGSIFIKGKVTVARIVQAACLEIWESNAHHYGQHYAEHNALVNKDEGIIRLRDVYRKWAALSLEEATLLPWAKKSIGPISKLFPYIELE